MASIALCSLLSIVWRHPLSDTAARAAAPFGRAVHGAGPDHRFAVGQADVGAPYWVWDARLTSFLLLLFLYLGYMALWNAIEDDLVPPVPPPRHLGARLPPRAYRARQYVQS